MIVHEVDKMKEQTREDRRKQLQEGEHKDTVTFWHRNDKTLVTLHINNLNNKNVDCLT